MSQRVITHIAFRGKCPLCRDDSATLRYPTLCDYRSHERCNDSDECSFCLEKLQLLTSNSTVPDGRCSECSNRMHVECVMESNRVLVGDVQNGDDPYQPTDFRPLLNVLETLCREHACNSEMRASEISETRADIATMLRRNTRTDEWRDEYHEKCTILADEVKKLGYLYEDFRANFDTIIRARASPTDLMWLLDHFSERLDTFRRSHDER